MTVDHENVLRTETYRVRMSDVDGAGIIYYANPLLWREGVFSSWLAEIGHPQISLIADRTSAPCVSATSQYLRPLRLDDVVELRLLAAAAGRTSFTTRFEVLDPGGELAVVVTSTSVWTRVTDAGMEPTPLPDWLREVLSSSR